MTPQEEKAFDYLKAKYPRISAVGDETFLHATLQIKDVAEEMAEFSNDQNSILLEENAALEHAQGVLQGQIDKLGGAFRELLTKVVDEVAGGIIEGRHAIEEQWMEKAGLK